MPIRGIRRVPEETLARKEATVGKSDCPTEELQRYYDHVYRLWQQNQCDYTSRYGDASANYGASISDAYDGEGDELAHLSLLLHQLNAELRR